MLRNARQLFIPLVIGIVVMSCEKLPQTEAGGEGQAVVVALTHTDSIPLEWGDLVAVTDAPFTQGASMLWFQDEAGTVRVVGYEHNYKRLWEQASVIGRR